MEKDCCKFICGAPTTFQRYDLDIWYSVSGKVLGIDDLIGIWKNSVEC